MRLNLSNARARCFNADDYFASFILSSGQIEKLLKEGEIVKYLVDFFGVECA